MKEGFRLHRNISKEDYEDNDTYAAFWDQESLIDEAEIEKKWPYPPKLKSVLSELEPFKSVLDFGCNTGRAYTQLFSEKEYFGVDIVKPVVDRAIERHSGASFEKISFDPTEWKCPVVDIVFCATILVHVMEKYFLATVDKLLASCAVLVALETDVQKAAKDFVVYCYNRDYRQLLHPYKVFNVKESNILSIFLVKGNQWTRN